MKHARFSLVALLATLALTAPSPNAHADPKDEQTRQIARDSFEEGLKLMDQHQWADARRAFLRAFAANNHPQIAGKLGETEMELGMYAEAKEHLSFALSEPYQVVAPERRQRLEALIAQAEKRLAPKPAQTAEAIAPPPPPDAAKGPPNNEGAPLPILLGEGGLALVFAGVGAGLWLAGDGKLADADEIRSQNGFGRSDCAGSAPPACADLASQVADADTLHNAALASFIAAGVSAVSVPLTLVFWPEDTEPVTVGLKATPGGAFVTGEF